MADEDRSPGFEEPENAGDDARAGWRVLDEQRARIDALRRALIASDKGDASAPFDYESFFTGKPEDDMPSS